MRPKTLLIIAALFVAVVSFYVVFEKVYLPKREKGKEKEGKVFTLTREDLDLIKIETKGSKVILVKEKDKDRWVMTAPVQTETDTGEVESFIASALDTQIGRKLGTKSELKEGLGDFGLTDPELTVVLGSGDKSEAILFGNVAPSGNEVYAMRKGDDQIFLVDDVAMEDLNKDTTTLRDKSLVAFSPDDVVSLSISRDGTTVTVKRQADESWLITEPFEFSADIDQITDILDFVTEEGAVGFAPEGASPKEYGLDPPAITLLIADKDGATSRLFIGKPDGEGGYWAMREGRPSIFMVSEQVKNKLTVSADFIMNRSLFTGSVPDVTSIEIAGPDGAISIARDDEGWKITRPEAVKGDRNAVNMLLGGLKEARLSEIVQKPAKDPVRYGLDKPTLTVTITLKEGGKERKSVLKLARGSGDTSYGYLSSGDFIFSIPTEKIADIQPTFLSLKDRSLLSFEADEITRADIAVADKTYVFKKKRGSWKMTEPERTKVDAESMDALLGAIGDLSYSEVLADTKDDLKAWGLDKPGVTITLFGNDDKEIGTVKLGEKKEEETGAFLPAVSSSLKRIYTVNADLVDTIRSGLDIIQEGR